MSSKYMMVISLTVFLVLLIFLRVDMWLFRRRERRRAELKTELAEIQQLIRVRTEENERARELNAVKLCSEEEQKSKSDRLDTILDNSFKIGELLQRVQEIKNELAES